MGKHIALGPCVHMEFAVVFCFDNAPSASILWQGLSACHCYSPIERLSLNSAVSKQLLHFRNDLQSELSFDLSFELSFDLLVFQPY